MALYHTHRPQVFSAVIGQEHIMQTLKNQILSGRVAHAYLFSGPRGVGKTTTARLLAKAVNCAAKEKQSAEPCNTCQSCQDITASRSLDVIEMDAASHTGVDNVRENIIDAAQFHPVRAPYKIFIIDEAHMLSTSAFNALLKTLEEPPDHVMFILATTDAQKLPDTIISRCQRFTFTHIPEPSLDAHLRAIASSEHVTLDDDVIRRVIKKSDGGARDAITLLDQLIAIGEAHITKETASLLLPMSHTDDLRAFMEYLFTRNAPGAIQTIDTTISRGMSLHQFMNDVVELLRLLLIKKSGAEPYSGTLDVSKEDMNALYAVGSSITTEELVHLADILLARREDMRRSALLQFPIELGVIEWCLRGEKKDPPKEEAEETKKQAEVRQTNTTTAQTAKEAWHACIKIIESESPSMAFIMNMATCLGNEGQCIRITVPYRLHKDKLMEIQCRRRIETLLSESLGKRAELSIEIQEDTASREHTIDDMAALFGGEVVQ